MRQYGGSDAFLYIAKAGAVRHVKETTKFFLLGCFTE
jgi:hypothetical protein